MLRSPVFKKARGQCPHWGLSCSELDVASLAEGRLLKGICPLHPLAWDRPHCSWDVTSRPQ